MMKSALSLFALASSASAFTTAPSSKTTTALPAVWDDYSGGFNFMMKEMKFDPVSENKPIILVGTKKLGILFLTLLAFPNYLT
jgi:Na+-transporting NADH:ubiquinone oxidoreductase subunit NqrB